MTRTRRLAALGLTVAALAGPASAQAYPLIHGPAGDAPDPDLVELDASDITPTRAIVVTDSGGVDWADAGAGFAAAACLGLLAAGTYVTIRAPRRSA
jgi:hypothetical protein